jgi:hypothetical protein
MKNRHLPYLRHFDLFLVAPFKNLDQNMKFNFTNGSLYIIICY